MSVKETNVQNSGSHSDDLPAQTFLHNGLNMGGTSQALTLGLWVQWPGGPVDLKTYWPPKKFTGPGGQ